MRRTLTVPEIDARLAARRARGVRATLFDSRLVTLRGRILADAEHEAYREAKARALAAAAPRGPGGGFLLPEVVRPEPREEIFAFVEAATALLECAPEIGESDAADLREMVSILGSWWPPAPQAVEDDRAADEDMVTT